jgi:mycoredoxin
MRSPPADVDPADLRFLDRKAIPAMLTMYTTDWCGYCVRLKHGLEREGIAYQEVNIERVPDAAEVVMNVNGGNRTVPTLVFPDGTAMTNPSLRDVKDKLAA